MSVNLRDLETVLRVLHGEIDDDWILAAVGRTGDLVHEILKREAVAMPTVRAAIAVAVAVTAQMLAETIEFGRKSMDGGEGGELLHRAAVRLFVELVNQEYPGALEVGALQ